MAAAVLVGAVAVLAVTLIIAGPSEREARPQRAVHSAPTAPATSERAVDGKCGLPEGDQRAPSTTPRGTRWELVGTMLAPTAPKSLGPAIVADGFRSCFARSPVGALYAAVNFWALGTSKPSAAVLRQLAADGRERTQAIAAVDDKGSQPAIRESMQLAGFRLLSYDSTKATVNLAIRLANGGLTSFPTTLRWEDGDWKYVIPPGGNPGVTRLSDLAGYIAWGGA